MSFSQRDYSADLPTAYSNVISDAHTLAETMAHPATDIAHAFVCAIEAAPDTLISEVFAAERYDLGVQGKAYLASISTDLAGYPIAQSDPLSGFSDALLSCHERIVRGDRGGNRSEREEFIRLFCALLDEMDKRTDAFSLWACSLDADGTLHSLDRLAPTASSPRSPSAPRDESADLHVGGSDTPDQDMSAGAAPTPSTSAYPDGPEDEAEEERSAKPRVSPALRRKEGQPVHAGSSGDSDDDPYSVLVRFSQNLTDAARAGRLNAPVGRDQEIDAVVRALSRADKNNPVLVGEPGVGKTAIVEGLAIRIAEGSAPFGFSDKSIFAINAHDLTRGTQFRGDFEARINAVMTAAIANPDILLFVDEIHTLMGAGASGGAMDAANILKPALARGSLRLIGATTTDEYDRYIAADGAFQRRLQVIKIAEPSPAQTRVIAESVCRRYSKVHGVGYTGAAIDAAISLSVRYLPRQFLPDKALDLLDDAGAAVKLGGSAKPPQRDVEPRDIADALSAATGLPVSRFGNSASLNRRDLIERLARRIALPAQLAQVVADSVLAGELGLGEDGRPLSVIHVVGPAGSGKSTLGAAIADAIDLPLLHVRLSDYADASATMRLVGLPGSSAAGDEPGVLVQALRRNKSGILLLDDVDRAHPRVISLLTSYLASGTLQDGRGSDVEGRGLHVVITATSGGAGADVSAAPSSPPGSDLHRLAALATTSVELPASDQAVMLRVVGEALASLQNALAGRGIELSLDAGVAPWLVTAAIQEGHGTQTLSGFVRSRMMPGVLDALAEQPAHGSVNRDGVTPGDAEKTPPGARLHASLDAGKLIVRGH